MWDFPQASKALLRRPKPAEPQPGGHSAVTRRDFIAVLGATTAAVGTGALISGPDLTIGWHGPALRISLLNQSWVINPTLFGGPARVTWSERHNVHRLRLAGAVLAGTDTQWPFRALLYRAGGAWRLRVHAGLLTEDADLDLARWLGGSEIACAPWALGNIQLAGYTVAPAPGTIATLSPSLTVRLAAQGIALSSPDGVLLRGDALVVGPSGERDRLSQLTGTTSDGASTTLQMSGIHPQTESIPLGTDGPAGVTYSTRFSHAREATVEAWERGSRTLGALLVRGTGTIEAACGTPADTAPAVLRVAILKMEDVGLLVGTDQGQVADALLAGRISRKPFGIDAKFLVALVGGDDDRPLVVRARDGRVGAVTADMRLYRAYVPVQGASTGHLAFPGIPIRIWFRPAPDMRQGPADTPDDSLFLASAPSPAARPDGALLFLGPVPAFMAPLDTGALQVARSRDLLDLRFEFRSYHIEVRNRQAWLIPAAQPSEAQRPRLIVSLPPQHLEEQAFRRLEKRLPERPADSRPAHPPSQGGTPIGEQQDTFGHTAAVQQAWPTRLVFQDCEGKTPRRIRLSVEELTNWQNLALVVNKRAMAPGTSLDEQLSRVGISTNTPREAALASVKASLASPDAAETSLELPFRLILSPDKDGQWITPRGAPPRHGAVLWSARLSGGNRGVRALWARFMDTGFIGIGGVARVKPEPVPVALTDDDRRQLVALTGTFGLPALRRLKRKEIVETGAANRNIDVSDTLSGTVTTPDQDYNFLLKSRDEGVWVPKPLDTADIVLTPLGANYRLEWTGEPPAPAGEVSERPWNPALTIERWRQRGILGRDILVEVAYKGYLFPLGHRASLIKLTERRFFRNPATLRPTAYLVQRRFIAVGTPTKPFPAYGQPYDGRPMPARTVRILTTQTPDLVDPEEFRPGLKCRDGIETLDNGRLREPDVACDAASDSTAGLAFWPKVGRGAGEEVQFEWQIDGKGPPVRGPLLFLDNAVAKSEDRLARIATHYNGLYGPSERLRTAVHGGARRRYAVADTSGETELDTDSWIMRAVGRRLPNADGAPTETFSPNDPIMEGEDQPPFYPEVDRALVKIQQVDRLLGVPQGLIDVRFSKIFREHGFDPEGNPSEIHLDVHTAGINLDFSGRGAASGGVAKPSATLAALSRKIGLVAGKVSGQPLLAGASTRPDITQALQGAFDPKEYFAGLLDAKILGLIPLKDVAAAAGIEGAPRLLERVQNGMGGAVGAAGMASAFTTVAEALVKILQEIEKTGAEWRPLYPRFAASITQAQTSLSVAMEAAGVAGRRGDLMAVVAAISPVPGALRTLLNETERLAADPVPPAIQEHLGELQRIIGRLRTLGTTGADIAKAFQDVLKTEFATACRSLPSDVAPLLFGASAAACGDLVNDLPAALTRLRDALFYEVFGETFATALLIARRLSGSAAARLRLVQADVEARLRSVLLLVTVDGQPVPTGLPDQTAIRIAQAVTAITLEAFSGDLGEEPAEGAKRVLTDIAQKSRAKVAEILTGVAEAERNRIVQRLTDTIGAMVAAEVQNLVRLATERVKLSQLSFASRISGEATSFLNAALRLGEMAWVPAKLADSASWCQAAAGKAPPFQEFGASFADRLLASEVDITDALAKLEDAVARIDLPQSAPAEAQLLVGRARAGLEHALGALKAAESRLAAARTALNALPPLTQGCEAALDGIKLVAECIQQRIRSIEAVRDTVQAAADARALLDVLAARGVAKADGQLAAQGHPWAAAPDIKKVEEALAQAARLLGVLLTQMTSIGAIGLPNRLVDVRRLIERLGNEAALKNLESYGKSLTEALKALEDAAGELRNEIAKAGEDPQKLLKAAAGTLAYAADHDRRLAALVLKSVAAGQQALATVEMLVMKIVGGVTLPLVALHAAAVEALSALEAVFAKSPLITALIAEPLRTALKTTAAGVAEDLGTLRSIQAATTAREAETQVRKLLASWQTGPTLVAAVEEVSAVVDSLVHGRFTALIDADALERQLRDAAAQFIPAQIDLSYDWGTTLASYPQDVPIFKMAPDRQGLPETVKDTKDLTLETRVAVDLIRQTRTVRASGRMKPFTIALLGTTADFLTIHFKGALFDLTDGGFSFSAPIDTVRIGEKLKFIQDLANALMPGKSGIYADPHLNPPEIEVGWRFGTSSQPLGTLILMDLAIQIAAVLPLDDRTAAFRFRLSEKAKPCVISSPPYGGAAFLAIDATPQGIQGFEASFEFGAVVPIVFGPLRAHGRITAGIYVRKDNGPNVLIEGFIHAMGEGNIGCFGIAVQIEVGLKQDNKSGDMQGYTSYSFSFKAGFLRISFSFNASYRVSKNKDKTASTLFLEAEDGDTYAFADAFDATEQAECAAAWKCVEGRRRRRRRATFRNAVPGKAQNWADYSKRYDMGW